MFERLMLTYLRHGLELIGKLGFAPVRAVSLRRVVVEFILLIALSGCVKSDGSAMQRTKVAIRQNLLPSYRSWGSELYHVSLRENLAWC
jgi:hypothetical protein